MQTDNKSDIARMRENIEAECIALNNLSLFTSTASHEIIQAKYRTLDNYHQQLKEVIGEDKAAELIVTIYNEKVQ